MNVSTYTYIIHIYLIKEDIEPLLMGELVSRHVIRASNIRWGLVADSSSFIGGGVT